MNIARLVRVLPRPFRRHRLVRALIRLSPRSAVQVVRFNGGARLVADVSDPFPRAYLLSGLFEPEFFAVAVPFLRPGGVFLDVGANVGFCSFGLMHTLAGGRPVAYHLFEANGRLCGLLDRSAALHPGQSVTVVHGCVTGAPGTSSLRVVPDQLGASYISEDGDETVPNVVLDDYLAARGVGRVPLMKMDIEGLEPRALDGARHSLSSGRIEAIYLELSAPNLARQGSSPAATLSALADAGFDVFFVRDVDLGPSDAAQTVVLEVGGAEIRARRVHAFPPDHQTDVLAVHRSSPVARAVRRP